MKYLHEAIRNLNPQIGVIRGDTYDNCVCDGGEKPTLELVEAEMVRLASPACTYAENRAREYPSIGEQLDMLWHAMNDGTAAKIEPFYTTIKAVKDKYPKTTD